jgi:L-lactate dehydrogenase complex protein LldG
MDRDEILSALRGQGGGGVELPEPEGPWIRFTDRRARFERMVEAAGGVCTTVERDRGGLEAALAQMPARAEARRIFSRVAGVAGANLDLDRVDDPHELRDLDLAVLPGHFGVAENGAVWVTDRELAHRAVYFLTQHLVLVLAADQLVDNLHQAYQRIAGGFREPGFGAFLAGPSKTADIEQSLVIGAHGCRSLTVLLLEG